MINILALGPSAAVQLIMLSPTCFDRGGNKPCHPPRLVFRDKDRGRLIGVTCRKQKWRFSRDQKRNFQRQGWRILVGFDKSNFDVQRDNEYVGTSKSALCGERCLLRFSAKVRSAHLCRTAKYTEDAKSGSASVDTVRFTPFKLIGTLPDVDCQGFRTMQIYPNRFDK